jgi:small subunit ribosomal protein S6
MRPYEVMMIFDTGAEAPAIQAVVERVLETVQAHGGTPGTVDRWGRRTFAYEVQHKREGYYVVIELTADPPAVADMERVLVLADEVLRHKVVRVPEKSVKRPSQGGRRHESAGPGPASTADEQSEQAAG